MSRTIELPDDVYRDLEKAARERGLTVAGWIAATLPAHPAPIDQHHLSELLQGLVGAVDSAKEPESGRRHTAFGDLIAKKLERQGLRRS